MCGIANGKTSVYEVRREGGLLKGFTTDDYFTKLGFWIGFSYQLNNTFAEGPIITRYMLGSFALSL